MSQKNDSKLKCKQEKRQKTFAIEQKTNSKERTIEFSTTIQQNSFKRFKKNTNQGLRTFMF